MGKGEASAEAIESLVNVSSSGNLKEMKALIETGIDVNGVSPKSSNTPLCAASAHGLVKAVDFLLEMKADVNLVGSDELTPLMHACALGGSKGGSVVRRLLEAQANVNHVRVDDEMTALKFAVRTCGPDIVQELLDRGAEVDGPTNCSQTALMIAARANNVDSLKVLVQNGADLTLTCKIPWAQNRTALGLAEMEKAKKAIAYLKSLA
jgi:ankyrin repeat protein